MMNKVLADDTVPLHSDHRMLRGRNHALVHRLSMPICQQSGFLQIRKRRDFQAVQEDTLEKGTTGIVRYKGEEERNSVHLELKLIG